MYGTAVRGVCLGQYCHQCYLVARSIGARQSPCLNLQVLHHTGRQRLTLVLASSLTNRHTTGDPSASGAVCSSSTACRVGWCGVGGRSRDSGAASAYTKPQQHRGSSSGSSAAELHQYTQSTGLGFSCTVAPITCQGIRPASQVDQADSVVQLCAWAAGSAQHTNGRIAHMVL
jgi:hypothetical protein